MTERVHEGSPGIRTAVITSRLGLSRLPSPARCVMIVVWLLVVLAAIYPRAYTSLNPYAIDPSAILAGPSSRHLLGTDEAGADIFTRIIYGTRLDAEICLFGVAIAYAIGVPLGLLAGLRRGVVNEIMTSLTGGILAFPIVLFALLVVGSFGASAGTLIAIFGFAFFPQVLLMTRAQTMAVYNRGYVLSARAAGLSYLGVGVQPPSITWGALLLDSSNYYHSDPLYAITAGLVITIVAALLLITGDMISESMDPLRRR